MFGTTVALLVLLSVGDFAAEAEECRADGTCGNQLEDESLMQLGRLGVVPNRTSFARNTVPYLGKGKGAWGAEAGALLINEDGYMNTYYLPGATIEDGGKTVKFTPPYRFYLMKTPTTDYSKKENFYMPMFAGKTFSVDVDFKRDGASCGCNLNFYLVSMPWSEPGKDQDYYCDAQCFPDMGCCAEFDMSEGNMAVQQVTNHACTKDYGGHPDWQCNKYGDPEVKTHASDFNIGPGSTIDSSKKFTYSQRFDDDDGVFTFTTTLSQEGREVVMKMGPGSAQMDAMLQELNKGMAFVTGYWFAPDMNWMDGEVCGNGAEHCNKHPAYISNWRITSNCRHWWSFSCRSSRRRRSTPERRRRESLIRRRREAPTPAAEGKCCWGAGCTNCEQDAGNWCNKNAKACDESCSGTWCTA